MHFSTFLATALLQASLGHADEWDPLTKPNAFPNLDWQADVIKNLPRHSSVRVSPWVSNNMAKGCRDRVLIAKKNPTDFKQYTIFIGDCDMPWWVCMEKDSKVTIDQLADSLARVPVGMRQYVGDIVNFKDGGGGAAWASQVVMLNGDAAKTPGVLLHESSHCIDGENGMGLKNGSPDWMNAFNKDTHVIDAYARTNQVENFASYAGSIIYNRRTNGGMRNRPEFPKIQNQFEVMARYGDGNHPWGSRIFDLTDSGRRCGWRWAHTGHVNPQTGVFSPSDDDKYHIRPTRRGFPSIIVKARDPLDSDSVTNCTGSHL